MKLFILLLSLIYGDTVDSGTIITINDVAEPTASVTWDVLEPADLEIYFYPIKLADGTYLDDRSLVINAKDRGMDYDIRLVRDALTIDWDARTVARKKTVQLYHVRSAVPSVPPTATLNVSKDKIVKGEATILDWRTTDAKTVRLNGEAIVPNGTKTVTPDITTTYLLTAESGNLRATDQRIVTVSDLPPPIINEPGLHVLIIEPDATRRSYEMARLIGHPTVTNYLNQNCVRLMDTAQWRVFDPKMDLTNTPSLWRTMMARPRTTLPWLVATNTYSSFEGPCPMDPNTFVAQIKELLK